MGASCLLPDVPDSWIKHQLKSQDSEVLLLLCTTFYRVVALPPIHKDPFDRVIPADALQRNLRVVSPDASFALYRCQVAW